MGRILILAATIISVTAVQAQEAPPPVSEKGPNFPTSKHGPAYPAVSPNQGAAPSFGATPPAPEQRDVPLRTQPEQYYGYGGRGYQPAQPER